MSDKELNGTYHNSKQHIAALQQRLTQAESTIQVLEDRLSNPETYNGMLFETSYSIKLIIDPDSGNIVDANQAASRFYGYERDTLINMNISDINQLSKQESIDEMQKAQQEQRQYFTFRQHLANGDIRDVEAFSEPIELSAKQLLYWIVRDITKQKQKEQELILLWHAMNQSATSVMITDKDGTIEYVNPYFTRLTGYSASEVIGKKPSILKSGDMSNVEYAELWQIISSGKEWSGEFHNKKKNGELFWEHAKISPVINSADEITHFVAIKENITEQKQKQQELEQSEYTLKRSQIIAHVGDWTWYPQSNSLVWSDEMYRIFGVDRDSFTGDLNQVIQQAIHPDDQEAVLTSNQSVIEDGKPSGIEYRVVWSDGTIRYVWAQPGAQETDDAGKITSLSGIVQDITERKVLEGQLQDAERFARSIVDALSAHIAILDENGVILDVNDAWRVFAQENGARVDSISPSTNYLAVLDAVDPASDAAPYAKAVEEGISQILRGEIDSIRVEYPCHSPDMQRWFVVHVTLFASDGPVRLVVAHENITDRKLAELANQETLEELAWLHEKIKQDNIQLEQTVHERTVQLHRLNNQMATILDNTSDALIYLDSDNRIESTNRAFSSMFGYDKDELIGQPLRVIADLSSQSDFINAKRMTRENATSQRLEIKARCKDDQTFDADVTLVFVNNNEEHMICSVHDITHLKEVDRAKDAFLSMVSHELKTPITSILLSIDMLTHYYDQFTDEKRLKKIAQIHRQANILTELVTAILDTTQFDSQRRNKKYVSLEIQQTVEAVVGELMPQAEKNDQHIEIIDLAGSASVSSHRNDITRVWRNLIGNAIKYSGQGSTIKVHLYTPHSFLSQSNLLELNGQIPAKVKEGNYIICAVEDNGPGISEEDMPQLFTRFYRGWAESTNIPGTGLGLSLVRDVVQWYGGDIEIHNVPDGGVTFYFWLPITSEVDIPTSSHPVNRDILSQ